MIIKTGNLGTFNLARSNDEAAYTSIATIDNTGTTRKTKTIAIGGVLGNSHKARIWINTIDAYLSVYGINLKALISRVYV